MKDTFTVYVEIDCLEQSKIRKFKLSSIEIEYNNYLQLKIDKLNEKIHNSTKE